jgi:hypothetical protein
MGDPWISVAVFGIAGLACAGKGGYELVAGLLSRREALASQDWPSAHGRVTAAKVVATTGTRVLGSRRSGGLAILSRTAFRMTVQYSYTVWGQTYSGHRINAFDSGAILNRAELETLVQRYRTGQPVVVYYRADRPKLALLDRASPSWRQVLAACAGWLLAAVCLVGLSAYLAL